MIRVAAMLALVASCTKAAPAVAPPAAPTEAADALWSLAPAGTTTGLVATPAALALAEGGAVAIRGALAQSPALAAARAMLDGFVQSTFGGPIASLADLGLDRAKGFAVFAAADGPVVVVPLADRAKLARATPWLERQTCQSIRGAYVCAASAKTLATAGTGQLPLALAHRGSVEVVFAEGGIRGTVVAQLERGSFVLRGAIDGVPAVGAPSAARVEAGRTASFGVIDLRALLASAPPDVPLVPGVTVGRLAQSVGGPLTVTVAAGTTTLDARIPLTDASPAAAVFAACPAIIPASARAPVQRPGMCSVIVPLLSLTLDIWVDGQTLRIGANPAPSVTREVALTPLGEELARGSWSVAMWGRGTAYSATGIPGLPATLASRLPAQAGALLHLATVVNELGVGLRHEGTTLRFVLGLRTLWANPPDVVAKLLAIPIDEVLAGGPSAQAIADAAPTAPFAGDVAAGPGGLILPVGTAGILAGAAAPAFFDYMQKSRRATR